MRARVRFALPLATTLAVAMGCGAAGSSPGDARPGNTRPGGASPEGPSPEGPSPEGPSPEGPSPEGPSPSRVRSSDAETPSPIPAPGTWTDAWLLAEAERYLDDRAFRRERLEASLTRHDNTYARSRLGAYALESGGWEGLPEWTPRARPVTDAVVAEMREGAWPTLEGARALWDGERPRDMASWVALGRRVFFEYPLRPEVFAEHALAHPAVAERIGLRPAADGTWPGVVVFEDLDRRVRVGITCALCHVAVEGGEMVEGRAHRRLDYGEMRLAYHRDTGAPLPERLAERMAQWGPGRADITQDDDEDPVAIPDLWAMREQAHFTQAGTLRHDHPAALAIRQETQILHANRERIRPPRELAWALAMYVYSLRPPAPARPAGAPERTVAAGRAVFDRHCRGCHHAASGSGALVAAERVGTDPALARGHARGTGRYRPSPLVAVADAGPYLHDGSVPTLEDLLDPTRVRPDDARGSRGAGAVPGHAFGTALPASERAALVAYLRTW